MEINFAEIEKKWQDRWASEKVFEVIEDDKKKKYYMLEMFPYPSGTGLHMGHALNYTIGDILARFKIMNGFNVLHPMGYDALGLPAENAAIKVGTHPEKYTNDAIENYKRQQKALGVSYDWSRVINTASPEYYRWDQWIFLKMLEKGLAYQKTSAVNWCPKCNTVLANEQVENGKCWRHENTNVEIKHLKQWFLKTTEYANELYENLDNMDWPERTKAMQKNWIGKSHGTEIEFEVREGNKTPWSIFTTRPDTIFGVTFMVVSAQHPKLNELVTPEQKDDVDKFLKKLKSVSEKDIGNLEKEGAFTGSYAINPATGKQIPIWTGNFVLADYGSGMVMAVPAHDQRDFEFAKKYGIEIKEVVTGNTNNNSAYTDSGILINSEKFNGLDSEEAKERITEWLAEKNTARKVVNFKLRDWGISRQRYWGTPIPIIHCDKCGAVPVPEKDLPVKLPKNVKFGVGNPLETAEDWMNVSCPKCKGKAKRETDTMDTFVNSSWYFLRYCDPKNDKKIFDKEKANYWCPIDTYIGGAEHACMHLIYFRFYTKFLRDLELINFDEPAIRLFHQGMLHAEDGRKMSKSLGNVIDPLETAKQYGVDAVRFFIVSVASPDKDFDWSEKEMASSLKFLKKIANTYENIKIGTDSKELLSILNRAIRDTTKQFDNFDYRSATIILRSLFDLLAKQKEASKETLGKALKILNPICPHITEELWEKLGNKNLISISDWPKSDESKIIERGHIENLNEKIVGEVRRILKKVGTAKKIYIYAIPSDVKEIDGKEIGKEIGREIKIFAVNDPNKYDPEGRAKRAKLGEVSIYLE